MATANICPNCDKKTGIVPCLGCEKHFCVKHFQVHRQNLFSELENLVARRNNLQEEFFDEINGDFQPQNCPTSNEIDRWEEKLHEQIRQIAQRARQQIENEFQTSKVKLNGDLKSLTENLQSKMDGENFLEPDINRLAADIDQIEERLREKSFYPKFDFQEKPIDLNATIDLRIRREEKKKEENPPVSSSTTNSTVTKVKITPSLQKKCSLCGTDTWQKECKCCSQVFCGWHLKRHEKETKKH